MYRFYVCLHVHPWASPLSCVIIVRLWWPVINTRILCCWGEDKLLSNLKHMISTELICVNQGLGEKQFESDTYMVDITTCPPIIYSSLLPCFWILYLASFGEVGFLFLAFLEAGCGQWDVGGHPSVKLTGRALHGDLTPLRGIYIFICESPLSCSPECGQGLLRVVLDILAWTKRITANSALMALSCWTKVINHYPSPAPTPGVLM